MKFTSKFAASCAAMIGLFAAAAPVLAQTAAETADAKDKIWAKEQSIYAGRAAGGLSNYVNATAPNYMAWPPFFRAPFGLKGLKDTQPRVAGAKEHITSEFKDFTLQGDTAVIYYTNHRTEMGDGTPVDQYFENIHVWVRIGGDWKVLGGMSRLRAPDSK
jgi:hypothetical protein